MSVDSKEIELKLRVAPADVLAVRKHPSFAKALHDAVTEALVSVYFDSDDLFMRDHGMTLRVRHAGERRIQTIKAANPASGIFERPEWEKAISGNKPDL